MKKIVILFLFTPVAIKSQTCSALYSYGANFENVHFFNQSISSNVRYYWSFGDGTSSNYKDPIHDFIETGTYLVTLFINDTISNCSGYYEQWLNITKYSTDPCSPLLSDSIWSVSPSKNYLKLINLSSNCNNYNFFYMTLGASNSTADSYVLPFIPGNFISSVLYYDSNSQVKRAASKTLPWKYDRSKNYQDCSANFEFSVISENTTSQTFLFKAMNKNATNYSWIFSGFGNPITRTTDTATIKFPGDINGQSPPFPWFVYLRTVGQNGCIDSLYHTVVIRKKSSTYVGIKNSTCENLDIKLFPNPVRDKMILEFNQSKITLDKISISNTLGQIVAIFDKPEAEREIDLSYLSHGVYYLKIQNAEAQKVFKVLKE